MKIVLFFCAILSLSSCGNENLGNDYYYLPDYEALDIGYPYGSIIYKSTQKNSFQKIIIPANVIKCDVEGDHILVVQKQDRQLIEKQIKEDSLYKRYVYLKRFFKNKNDTNYYIINKSKEIIDGPLTKAQFDYKKSQF